MSWELGMYLGVGELQPTTEEQISLFGKSQEGFRAVQTQATPPALQGLDIEVKHLGSDVAAEPLCRAG